MNNKSKPAKNAETPRAVDLGKLWSLMQRTASEGDVEAQYLVGLTLITLSGTDKQAIRELATNWARRVEGAKDASGNWFANLCAQIPDDAPTGRMWIARAAENEERVLTPALRSYAALCQHGIGGPKDEATMLKLTRRGVEAGDLRAQVNLGIMYKFGIEVRADPKKAAEWLAPIAWRDEGEEEVRVRAIGHLVPLMLSGEAPTDERGSGIDLCRRGAELGDPTLQGRLGRALELGEHCQRNLEEAAFWYREAADQGHPEAQNILAGMYYNGEGVPVDRGEGLRLYEQAVAQNHPEAMVNLALRLGGGIGFPGRKPLPQEIGQRTLDLLTQAANLGQNTARYQLGIMLWYGQDTRQDIQEGGKLLYKACDAGDEDAARTIVSLLENLFPDLPKAAPGTPPREAIAAAAPQLGPPLDGKGATPTAWAMWYAVEAKEAQVAKSKKKLAAQMGKHGEAVIEASGVGKRGEQLFRTAVVFRHEKNAPKG